MCIDVNLVDIVDEAQTITVYNDGEALKYNCGEQAFDSIVTAWHEMTDGSHEMPAFGVSLNSETVKAMSVGVWVEFAFAKQLEYNGMPFEKLLINVQKSFTGFNIIRYTSERGYDGRCFYLDILNKNMGDFYNILIK